MRRTPQEIVALAIAWLTTGDRLDAVAVGIELGEMDPTLEDVAGADYLKARNALIQALREYLDQHPRKDS